MDQKEKKFVIYGIYFLLLAAVCIPLTCGYVMEGGQILSWLARGEEVYHGLQSGTFMKYPSAELVSAYGMHSSAFDLNIWMLPYAGIRWVGGSITAAYVIYMLFIQIGTLFSARSLFRVLFEDEVSVFFGVLFYLTCPYRIYLCYDQGNLLRCVAWMLLPMASAGLVGLIQGRERKIRLLVITVAAMTGVAYADQVLFVVAIGCILIGSIWYRKPILLFVLVLAVILAIPGLMYLIKYLIMGGMEAWQFPMCNISDNGYHIGQFFTSYAYHTNLPGMGLGITGALSVWFWYRLIGNRGNEKWGFTFMAALLFLMLSLAATPWELIQRLGTPFLRWVSLLESPTVFFGQACALLTIPSAYAIGKLKDQENPFIKLGIPAMILAASVGVEIYICNSLTYHRLPMYLIDNI